MARYPERLDGLPLKAVLSILQQLLDRLDLAIIRETVDYANFPPTYELVTKAEAEEADAAFKASMERR
jgi:hypothetical protein